MPLDLNKLTSVQRNGADWKARCPACVEHGADRGGDHLIIFQSGAYGCAADRTAGHYSRIYALAGVNGTEMPAFRPLQYVPTVEMQQTWPPNCLERLVKDYSYWAGRGISETTLTPFRGGVATIGQLKNRYVFPMFNERDEIVGFDGRWVLPQPPRLPPGVKHKNWKLIGPSSEFVWGGLDEIGDRIILVESIGDSLKLREYGVPETLCLFGTHLSEKLLGWILARNPRQIIVSTNLDEEKQLGSRRGCPGQEAALRIMQTLEQFFSPGAVSIIHPPEGVNDWGVATSDQIRATFL